MASTRTLEVLLRKLREFTKEKVLAWQGDGKKFEATLAGWNFVVSKHGDDKVSFFFKEAGKGATVHISVDYEGRVQDLWLEVYLQWHAYTNQSLDACMRAMQAEDGRRIRGTTVKKG